MFRALFWKQWRQLALIRWGGIAIGAMLPLAFTAGAEMAERGLLPLSGARPYSVDDIMFEIIPKALGIALWPLVGLMVAAEAFGGDRAAGTEGFLLERPVPRTRVWLARVTAALATLVTVIATTVALGGMLAKFLSTQPTQNWKAWAEALGGGGALALLAFLGSMLASSLIAAQLGAVLGGAILAATPVLVGGLLTGWFPHARIGIVPIGTFLPLVMLPGYAVASWSACCRGEPAGRGRIKRGLSIGGLSALVVLLLFAIMAPAVVRANARSGMHSVFSSPSGRFAMLGASRDEWGGGGWIVDVAGSRKIAFVPPPIQAFVWSPDESKLAIVTWSAAFGGQEKQARIDIVRMDDGAVERSIDTEDDTFLWGVVWTPDGIAAAQPKGERGKRSVTVSIVDPATGAWRGTGFTRNSWATLAAPRADGRVLLRLPVLEADGDRDTVRGYWLLPVDAREARVKDSIADTGGRARRFAGWLAGLSPDGRFGTIVPEDNPDSPRMVELATDRVVSPVPNVTTARWLAKNHLVWTDALDGRTRLFVVTPEGSIAAVREWKDARVTIEPSPDGRTLLVSAIPLVPQVPSGRVRAEDLFSAPAPAGIVPEQGLLQDDGRWVSVPTFSANAAQSRETQWAGARTLARIAPNVVYFEDLDAPGTKRFVLGSEADLR